MTIWELLLYNGIVEFQFKDKIYTNINNENVCSICGVIWGAHPDFDPTKNHEFKPVAFSIVTGQNKKIYEANGDKYFNSINNNDGHNLKILICSPVVWEGYQFTDVKRMIIYNYNKPLPRLIQLLGRVVWLNSHSNSKKKHCIYNILLNKSTITPGSEFDSFKDSI